VVYGFKITAWRLMMEMANIDGWPLGRVEGLHKVLISVFLAHKLA
jgi:hypothetical protein